MKTTTPSARERLEVGFSLIEVLVGLAIGIIGILAIFQTVGIWNRHVQTTSSGGDAQVAGAMALFDIERDFRQSGHGFGKALPPVMGCLVNAFDSTGRGAFQFRLRPVDIGVGPGGAPDTINVLYGNSSFFVESQDFLGSTPISKALRRRGGFKMGDLLVVADAGGAGPGTANCNMAEITSDANPDLVTIDHAPSGGYTTFYGVNDVSHFNEAGGFAFASTGTIFNLGPSPQRVTWQIVGNRTLQRSELIFNRPADQVADGVINLKAEYGIDVNKDTKIQPGEWLPAIPVGSDWTQVLAIRVALLVRSRQFERSADPGASTPTAVTAVTALAPSYFGGTPFTMTNVDGSPDTFSGSPNTPDPNNWRFYRYRVYERVIPLKNLLWAL